MQAASKKIFLFCLFLVPFTLMLPRSANNFAIGLLILSWLGAQPWKMNERSISKKTPVAWISILIVLIYAASFLWTSDVRAGMKVFEVIAPMLIFPVTLSLFTPKEIKTESILRTFLFTISSLIVLCVIIAIFRTLDYGLYYRDPVSTVTYNNFLYHGFASGIGIHPSFLSLFCGFGIIAIINLDSYNLGLSQVSKVVLLLILISGMVLLQAVTIALATGIAILLIILFKSMKFGIQAGVYVLIAVAILAIFGIIIVTKFDVGQNLFSYDIYSSTGWNSINLRLALWDISFNAIKESPLWGYGLGDAQAVLLTHYQKVEFFFAAYNNYQPHNQLILSWLMAGLPLVLATTALFIAMLISALKKRHYLYLAMVLILLMFSMTDIPLVRNKPLVFFMFFVFIFEYSLVSPKD